MNWLTFFFNGAELFTMCYLAGQFVIFAALLIGYYVNKSVEHKTLEAIRQAIENKKATGEVLTIASLNALFLQQNQKSKYVQQWNRYYERASQEDEKVKVEPYFSMSALHFAIGERGLLELGGGVHTTIGVLGTFIGLTYGLSGLNVINPEELRGGIDNLLSGMTTAFLTSIMGIVLSLMWIFIDRKLTMKLEEEINWHASELTALLTKTDEQTLVQQLESMFTPLVQALTEQNELMRQYMTTQKDQHYV